MHRALGAGLAAAASLALAAPAQAQLSDTYFFKCSGPSKVQNGATISPAVATQAFWSTVKPTTSFTAGGGCGFADNPAVAGVRPSTTPENFYDAYYKGVHAKAIQDVELELHNLVTSRARQGDTGEVLVRISEGTGTTATTLAERTVSGKFMLSSTGASEMLKLSLPGVNIKPGTPDRVLNITVHSTGATPQAWVHDASEVPASVTFVAPPPKTA